MVRCATDATICHVTTTADGILQDALSLSDRDGAEIAARLLESLDQPRDADAAGVEEPWAAEIERRCAALDAGTTGTTDWEDVQREIEAEILRK